LRKLLLQQLGLQQLLLQQCLLRYCTGGVGRPRRSWRRPAHSDEDLPAPSHRKDSIWRLSHNLP
jgi:hypothetical protein